MEQYKKSKREVLESLHATEGGLTGEEAQKRLNEYGLNVFRAEKKKSVIGLFFAQFKDLMTIILICAACLSAVLAYLTRDASELADTGILLFVILLNAIVGFLQQYRADAAIEKLKKLSVATAKVVRDGKIFIIDASELVVGDIIELEEGDRIPADCRILTSENFRADESTLTGESRPVKKSDCVVKKTALADRENTVHFGTFCVSGYARCVVTATGMNTEMGAISKLLHESKSVQSPLDKTVEKLGKIISVTVLTVAGLLFIGGLIARRISFLDNLMTAIAVAVAAIPEGMGAVVTIILAMGVQRMSASRAVIRRLSSVETLGSCTCICSDKTGTLTQNKMTVEKAVSFAGGSAAEERMLSCMRVCHTVKGNAGSYIGDPTEIALVEYADKKKMDFSFTVLGGIPFSSERKMMSVAASSNGTKKLYVKGGADVLLKKCTHVFAGDIRPLTDADRKQIKEQIALFSSQAMRVLAFAEGQYSGTVKEEGLTFLGLAALFDPPKEGAKEAVLSCKKAGIKTVMITGDSAETAFEIARRLGIAENRDEVLSGEQIDAMNEEEFASRVQNYRVYARVSPKHKLQIVRALQKRGEIVAMTGDGVNDAPSVKAADIGVAMGSGTDVTKNAADMVIADDNFATMVHAVEEGRNVFFNVKKTISFFMSTNLGEVFSVLIATLFLWKFDFLTSTQLLWINLITDSLPVLALGVERTFGSMNRAPVNANEIFSKQPLLFMLFFGAVQTAIVIAVFMLGLHYWGNAVASTCAFLVLSLLELFHAFNVRKERERITFSEFFSNKALLVTVLIGIAVNVLLVAVPFLAGLFDLSVLNGIQWLIVFASSLVIIPVGELYKVCLRVNGKAKKVKMRRKRIPVADSMK